MVNVRKEERLRFFVPGRELLRSDVGLSFCSVCASVFTGSGVLLSVTVSFIFFHFVSSFNDGALNKCTLSPEQTAFLSFDAFWHGGVVCQSFHSLYKK